MLAPEDGQIICKDPYETFVQEQANREKLWKPGYSKNHKKSNDPKNDENKTVSAVALESHDQDYKTELRLKKVECQNLREKIKHLEENALARTNIIDVRRNH